MSTTKEVLNTNYEGVPTTAPNMANAVDFQNAVLLGLEQIYLRPIAVDGM